MLPDWQTAGLPFRVDPARYTVQIVQEPLRTEFDQGDPRARQLNSAVNASVAAGGIFMTSAQIALLWDFIADDLRAANYDFTMPIWTGTAYELRTCHLLRIPQVRYLSGEMDGLVDLELLVKGFR